MSKQILSKGISTPIGILIIVLVAIIAGGGILAYQYYWMPEEKYVEAPPLVKDETADWQTYTNEEYGFEVKYPNNYYIEVSGKREEGGLIYDLLRVAIDKEPLSDHRTPLVAVNVAGPNFVLGTRDWEDFFLGEIDGSISYNWEDWKVREKVSSAEIIFTSENNQIFYVITQNDPLEDKVINQMLSTFRFIEKETYIDVIQPKPNQVVSSPFQIKGEISIFEKVMDKKAFVELTDNNNHKLFPIMGRFEGKSYFSIIDTKTPFSLDVPYVQPSSKKGTIKIFVYIPTENFEPSEKVLESWSPETLIEIPIIFDENLLTIPNDWNTYSNPEAKFTFRYPKDWDIISEYFYETPAGFKSEGMTVTLEKEEKGGISINLRQAMCSSPCWCKEVKDNIIQTCPKDSEALEVFNKIVSTFKVLD